MHILWLMFVMFLVFLSGIFLLAFVFGNPVATVVYIAIGTAFWYGHKNRRAAKSAARKARLTH